MEEQEVQLELQDQLGNLSFVPPPMKKSDTRDSISSVDSDVSLSFDRRGSKGEEADLSDSGSSDCGRKTGDESNLQKKQNKISDPDSGADSLDDVVPKELENQIPKEKVSTTTMEDFIPPSDELADKICTQVEFYFSDENIVKDAFLLKHVKRNKEGYVSLKLISSFKRVKHLSRDWRVVGAALARSKKLQVNEQGTKLRRIDPLPPFDQTTPSRTVLAARLPVEKLSVESVAELFKSCGEIALIRVLRPGHPAPAEIRQAIAKRPDLASSEECAMIEFIDSASARMALQMPLGEAKIYVLQQPADKKRKQQPPKKNTVTRVNREESYNSSSCGSENEEGKSRHRRQIYNHPVYHVFTGHPFQPGPPSPETWMPRRLSSCSIPGADNGLLLRRLSSCSGSGSETENFNRRFSSCSSSSETGFYHAVYPPGYYPPNRRFSYCSASGSGSCSGSDCNGACFSSVRRGSGDCGPFLRRLSACSRDSGYEIGTRRLSSCSSSSETGFFRPRSNSGIVVAHLPENVTRLPSGPDGTRGFGRPPRMNPMTSAMEPACWPRVLNSTEPEKICAVVCNRDKILFAILTTDSLAIWYCKPCVPIVFIRRPSDSLNKYGENILIQWRPDSSMLVVATSDNYLLFYRLSYNGPDSHGLYEQRDSPVSSLRRDSAELFIKEVIPSLTLNFDKSSWIDGGISSLVCIRDELMVATKTSHVVRHKWDGTTNRDYSLDLRRIPFSVDQQISTVAIPITENNIYVADIEYSPLVGGFAIVLSNGKAAFLTAQSLKFDPNQVQGIWARDLDDATCAAVNHKYRLIACGKRNSEGIIYYVDERTGGLEVSHSLSLSSKDYPGRPGQVTCLRWTPDSCAIAMAWEGGGLAIWSTFGALLLCSLKWDYGLRVDLTRDNPLHIHTMEWSAEGYQLWMLRESHGTSVTEQNGNETVSTRTLMQMDFVKSPLTVNPCMGHHGHLYLQGEDRLYLNLGSGVSAHTGGFHLASEMPLDNSTQTLSGSKQWLVVPIPIAYSGSNWPIRFTAIDNEGLSIAVAGRTGLAHYSLPSRKWKLFGNETQERDFIVTGGLLWHRGFLIASSYSLLEDKDEIRIYPRDTRLDNSYVRSVKMPSQVLLLNTMKNHLLTFCANAQISIYSMVLEGNEGTGSLELTRTQTIDIGGLCVHPVCVVSATLTSIRAETAGSHPHPESLLLNVSGRLLMVQREHCTDNSEVLFTCGAPTVLASCVENVWVPWRSRRDKPHLTEALWLFCGAHGMRVWLPLFPRNHQDKVHTFMSKRIMLPFHLRIYPLAILFEEAILLGAENDTVLYTSDTHSLFSLPFCLLELTSQVYLHQILRQLIHRNLGYHAWEIARSCSALPYFPHSLELLLHEVLEEEATSKEPIPDAQLPSVVEFIREFPGVWARAVVQCARKTEIALWPYLFSVAGPPKKLLQDCLQRQELDTAASYLIILQNLEPSSVSRQHATLLLDAALEQGRWELSKDLVRFLRAIDPNDVESPRTSWGGTSKLGGPPQTPPLSPQEDDLSLVLGTMQVSRSRSYSTTVSPKVQSETGSKESTPSSMLEKTRNVVMRRKKSVPTGKTEKSDNKEGSAEEFFIDVILQRHARRLLSARRLADLGRFAAHLDFHLVTWLARERDRAARLDDFVIALKAVHEDFIFPYPLLSLPSLNKFRRSSITSLRSIRSSNLEGAEEVLNANIAIDLPDSGYTSLPSSRPPYTSLVSPVASLETQFPVAEANLTPHMLQDSNSVISDTSTIWRDDIESIVGTGVGTVCWVTPEPLEPIEIHVPSPTGPVSRAEVQLRYLLQLFLEGGCLGWAAVLATVLRDAPAMARTVRTAYAPMQTLESVINLRDGLHILTRWSHSECLGYRPFMSGIQGQISLLNRLIMTKQQEQETPESPSPSPAPSAGSQPRGNASRSRHSSISHTSTTALEEERTLDTSSNIEEASFRGSHSNLKDLEVGASQSGCILS